MNESITLLQLNHLVRDALSACLPDSYWIRAEVVDVRQASSGHCYFEFVEKEEISGSIVARASGRIWAATNRQLKPKFERETGQPFATGLKVLARVTVEFHPQYGFSLTMVDIDSSFTLGEMARQRLEIVNRLESEGLLPLNKRKELATPPRRIAVISSATAAGYEDFMNQLTNNAGGFMLYTHLFPALMQGAVATASIQMAIDQVAELAYLFDALVIIRGGGATSELSCFDSYELGVAVARFPLPVIVGIGHERDSSVLDLVAHTRVKTPTAAAEFLLGCFQEAEELLIGLTLSLRDSTRLRLEQERNRLLQSTNQMNRSTLQRIHLEKERINRHVAELQHLPRYAIESQRGRLQVYIEQLRGATMNCLSKEKQEVALKLKIVELSSPLHILEKGYAYVTASDQLRKRAAALQPGDEAQLHFVDGAVKITIQ